MRLTCTRGSSLHLHHCIYVILLNVCHTNAREYWAIASDISEKWCTLVARSHRSFSLPTLSYLTNHISTRNYCTCTYLNAWAHDMHEFRLTPECLHILSSVIAVDSVHCQCHPQARWTTMPIVTISLVPIYNGSSGVAEPQWKALFDSWSGPICKWLLPMSCPVLKLTWA